MFFGHRLVSTSSAISTSSSRFHSFSSIFIHVHTLNTSKCSPPDTTQINQWSTNQATINPVPLSMNQSTKRRSDFKRREEPSGINNNIQRVVRVVWLFWFWSQRLSTTTRLGEIPGIQTLGSEEQFAGLSQALTKLYETLKPEMLNSMLTGESIQNHPWTAYDVCCDKLAVKCIIVAEREACWYALSLFNSHFLRLHIFSARTASRNIRKGTSKNGR